MFTWTVESGRSLLLDASGRQIGEVRYGQLPSARSRKRIHDAGVRRRHQAEDPETNGERLAWSFVPARRDLVSPRGVRCHLSRDEARVLAVLERNAGRTVNRKLLLQSVCYRFYGPGARYIDQLVANLRRKFTQLGVDDIVTGTSRDGAYTFRPAARREVRDPGHRWKAR